MGEGSFQSPSAADRCMLSIWEIGVSFPAQPLSHYLNSQTFVLLGHD